MNYNEEIKQVKGDNLDIFAEFTQTDSEGVTTPVNLTGAQVFLTVKERATDLDADALFQIIQGTHSDPVNGKTVLPVTKDKTENAEVKDYYFDIQIIFSDGKVKTPNIGRWKLIQGITDANSQS